MSSDKKDIRTKRPAAAIAAVLLLCLFSGAAGAELEVLDDFTFKGIDGRAMGQEDLRGKPVVINAMATWCPPCKREAPALERAYQEYRDRGVIFLGVFVTSTEGSIRKFAGKYGLTFPVGTGTNITEHFGWKPFPATAFVSRDGTIVSKHFGQVGYEDLVRGIEEILK